MRRILYAAPLLLAACRPGNQAAMKGCQTMTSTADIPVTPTYDSTQVRRTASGLGILDLRVGTGATAQAGNMVSVHYTGWLTDGKEFDSSRRSGQPLNFGLGRQQVIAGWDEGIAGMQVGGRRKLIIPASLGYGPSGSGPIPPNATMIFDVELCAVR